MRRYLPSSPWSGFVLTVAVLIVFGANIAISFWKGRLAEPPTYDDVSYLIDGFRRLYFMSNGNIIDGAATFLPYPPHSYWSTSAAMLGYLFFGPHYYSPYLVNFVPLVAYAVFFYWAARSLDTGPRLAATVLMLFAPACHMLINEFRPDMAGGLFFAIALYLLAFSSLERLGDKKLVAIGAFVAFAATVKPSSMVLTVPILGLAALIGFAASAARIGFRSAVRALAPMAIVGLAAFALFLVVFGPSTFKYIYSTLVTGADIWRIPGDRWYHWTYHSFGEGGSQVLGPFLLPGLVILVVDLLLALAGWRNPRNWPPIAMVGVLLILYAGMSLNPSKSPYHGCFFYFPFLVMAFAAAMRLAARWREFAKLGPYLGLAATVLWVPVATSSSYYVIKESGRNDLQDAIVQAIAAKDLDRKAASCPARAMTIASVAAQPISAASIALSAAVENRLQFNTMEVLFPESLQVLMNKIRQADFVILPADIHYSRSNYQLPSHRYIPEVRKMLDADSKWRSVAMPWADGAVSTLYVKASC